MKLAIKLAGDTDGRLKRIIDNISCVDAICYTDKNKQCECDAKLDLEIRSIFEVVSLYLERKCDGILISYKNKYSLLKRMIAEASSLGIPADNCYIALPEFYVTEDDRYIVSWNQYKCLPYIEFHVADHCNLNCKGCVHFSPLVECEQFCNTIEIRRDLIDLKKVVSYIEEIHILGGEPLLNPDLEEIINITSEIYPYSRIGIVTNGLLVKQMSENLIDVIKENNVRVNISLYPPLYEKIGEIIDFLNEKGIDNTYTQPMKEFSYAFNKSGGLAKEVKKINCVCPNLYHGKVYICPIIAYSKYYNSYFKKNLIDENEGAIALADNIEYKDFINFLHQPVKLCDRCLYISKEKEHTFKWAQTKKPTEDDWVY